MLCRSIMVNSLPQVLAAVCGAQEQGVDAVELRLDHANLQIMEDLAAQRQLLPKIVATYHGPDNSMRRQLLLAALDMGVDMVDLPLQGRILDSTVMEAAHEKQVQVVGSYHNHMHTPTREILQNLVALLFAAGADIAKVACKCQSRSDAARLIGLLDTDKPVVALGMGSWGKLTRVAASVLDAPLNFVPASQPTAEGQIPDAVLKELVKPLRP